MISKDIRFRVWCKSSMVFVERLTWQENKSIIFAGKRPNKTFVNGIISYVNSNRLMRNTGICDSNDKEIWEDDIVKVEYNPPLGEGRLFYGTIFNDNGLWMIDFQNEGTSFCISGPEFETGIESVEVIGNIWESKDLFDIEKMELLVK